MAIIRKTAEHVETPINVRMNIAQTKDGRKFVAYKFDNDGKLVDLRFTREAAGENLTALEDLAKQGVTRVSITVVDLQDASARYTYPRFYARGIVGDIIVY